MPRNKKMLVSRGILFLFLLVGAELCSAQYRPSRESVPSVPYEFRGAWAACVYNIDWPSSKGLSPARQKGELIRILDRMASLKMNALIFQVRPQGDAVYNSRIEPWSSWLSGRMGKSPGYDPLAFCISQAHARGIEVHAWFNPFRALPNRTMPTSSRHISKTHPSLMKNFRNYLWMDPSKSYVRQRALQVILDVTSRYDVDGIHIDDYFYPYPEVDSKGRPKQRFPDGLSPGKRRQYVNAFVKDMYKSVKQKKPWVRVGISPFGIWRPGVPSGTTAKLDAYEHISADSRLWLRKGWCDYLAPQLYWRIKSPQSYTRLLEWWRKQGGNRPVWPGIATSRIKSKEDAGRPAGEILHQVYYSRKIGRNYAGHIHWSVKSLLQNRDGVSSGLSKHYYQEPALTPPMKWVSKRAPSSPPVHIQAGLRDTTVSWNRVRTASKYVVQARYGNQWRCVNIVRGDIAKVKVQGKPNSIAVSAANRYGNISAPTVLTR